MLKTEIRRKVSSLQDYKVGEESKGHGKGQSSRKRESHMKGAGMLVGNLIKPLKETDLGVAQTFFDP